MVNAEYVGDRGILEREISGISIDSRTAKSGDLFFAIVGDNFNAHQFVADVLQQQVMAVVVSKKWYNTNSLSGNFVVVDDTLTALQEAAHCFRLKFKFPFLGITGSNGKTTTKEMIADVLSQKFAVLKNKGNLNNHVGVPLTLFTLKDSYELAIIEMGSNHFGEIKRLAEISEPEFGLITNIGPAHLEFFGTVEGVAREKTELWHVVENKNGVSFVNIDDAHLAKRIPRSGTVITYGFDEHADIKGEYLSVDETGAPKFRVLNTEIKLKVTGMHNIYNALAAVAVGLEFNVNVNQIKQTLEDFVSASKRMEVIKHNGLVIINDSYNSNLLSAQSALNTLAQMKTNGRRIAVLSDMLELGAASESHHIQVGDLVARLRIDYLLTYGPFSRFTHEQALKTGLRTAIHFDTKMELIKYLHKLIKQEDVVLIKGSRGMAMERVTETLLKGIKSKNES